MGVKGDVTPKQLQQIFKSWNPYRIFAQVLGQIDVASSQKIRPQTTNLIFGHFRSQQCSQGSNEIISQHTVQLHNYQGYLAEAAPSFAWLLLFHLLLPFFERVSSKMEEFYEGDEKEDDAYPDENAVLHGNFFGKNWVFQIFVWNKQPDILL